MNDRQTLEGDPSLAHRGHSFGRWYGVLIVAVGIAVYLNSFSGAFVFDDGAHITENQRIRHLLPLSEVVAGRRPVVQLSLAVNYALGGESVWGYHAFNLAVHILAALILFGAARRTLLIIGYEKRTRGPASRVALVISLIWLVHPLQTQSVTYIVQRGASLMGLFYLTTLYCMIRGTESRRFARPWYAGAIAACALGMASKAVIVTAPVVLFLYDCVFLERSPRDVLRRRWGLYLGLAATWGVLAACGVFGGVLDPARTTASVGFGFQDISPLDYALTQSGVILHYLRLSLWPFPQCLDYGWPVSSTFAAVVGPALVLVVLLLATVHSLWHKRRSGFLGVWFFVILAPTSSFVPIRDVLFEHRMYLPLAAVVAVAVIGARAGFVRFAMYARVSQRRTRAIACLLAAITVALLGTMTIRRNRDYHSEVSMWRDVVVKRPQHSRGHQNLGDALSKAGQHAEALRSFRRALEIDPTIVRARCNLGVALLNLKRLDEAWAALQEAVRLDPEYANTHRNMGVVLFEKGNVTGAIDAFREAVRLRPDFDEAHYNLGFCLHRSGRVDDAVVAFREALRINPLLTQAHSGLAGALSVLGQSEAAGRHYELAGKPPVSSVENRIKLGNELLNRGRLPDAERWYRAAVQLDPRHAGGQLNLGLVLARQGRNDEAIAVLQHATELSPANAAPHFHLANLYRMQGRLGEAAQSYREVLRIEPSHRGARRALEALASDAPPPGGG